MGSRYRVEQRIITHLGRSFRFVSYDGQPVNAARKKPATEPAWFLVNAGYRLEVMPQLPGEDLDDVDRRLKEWLEAHVAQ